MGTDITEKHKLYLRLPVKIKDEFQVKELNPNITQVHLPRQKSRRWCFVDFASREKLQEARASLKLTKINGVFLKVKDYKISNNQTPKQNKKKKIPVTNTRSQLHLLKNLTS